jgi:predicted phage tail protein
MAGQPQTYTSYTECRDVQVPIYGPTVQMSDRSRAAVRKSFMSPVLEEAVYEIRIKRVLADDPGDYVSDTVYVSDINEIITDDVSYKHTALLGLKIQLTDQLNGPPKVTYLSHGRYIRVWDGLVWRYQASANPAWITLDMMTHSRYGGGMLDTRIDMDKWKEWAAHCDSEGLTFNGIIESQSNLWDAMQYVFRAGHAQIVNMGTRYSVVIEKAEVAVQMFSVGNIIKGTFKQSWLPVTERANEIEVSYFDKMDNYKKNSIKVYDPIALTNGSPSRSANITLVGVDNKEQAHKEGVFQLNLNRYVLQTVEFGAPIEAIAATVGSVIYVQHDMPQWGYGGRIESLDSASALNLDRPVPMSPGVSYKALAFFDAIQRFSGSITSVIGDSIILAGYDGSSNIKRLKANGLDKRVLSVFTAGANYGVILEDSVGLSNGQAYTLWDTDVIEERDVLNTTVSPIEVTEISVITPFSAAPAQFSNWMYGPVDKVKKPFRIKTISGSHEYRRDITAIEYNDSVYDLNSIPAPVVNFSNLDSTVTHATINDVKEILVVLTGNIRSEVTVYFTSTQSSYKNSRVYVSRNGGAFEFVTAHFDRAMVEADTGDELIFKVVATDMVGASAPETSAPTITHTVVGKTAPPQDVTGFAYGHIATGTSLTWNHVTDVDFNNYIVKIGIDWATGTVVYTGNDNRALRPFTTPGTYAYKIKAVDTSGNESLNAAPLSVVVAAPGVVTIATPIVAGSNFTLTWGAVVGSYPTKHYVIRKNGTFLYNHDSTTFSDIVTWGGNETFSVAPVDLANNEGPATNQVVGVTIPAAPTGVIATNLVNGVETENLTISWLIPTSSLDIKDYIVKYGTTLVERVKGDRVSVKVDWVGLRTFTVAAYDVANNLGAEASVPFTVIAHTAPILTSALPVALKLEVIWSKPPPVVGSLPVAEYEIRHGTSFTDGASVSVIKTSSLSYRIPIDWTGSRSFWLASRDTAGNLGAITSVPYNVTIPAAPSMVDAVLDSVDFVLTWTAAASVLPIEEYEVRHGASFDAGVSLGRVKGTTLRGIAAWSGLRIFWVAAYNQNGTVGAKTANDSLTITSPNAPVITSQVIDNNVLLRWTESVGSLPIKHYEVYKGTVFATASMIGTVGGRFSAIFETESGTYIYWVRPVDAAGNFGTESSTAAEVSQPPDYVLFDQQASEFDSTTQSKVTRHSPNKYALNIDADTKYGSVASITDLDSGITGITFECWIKNDFAGDATTGFMDKSVGGVTNTCFEIYGTGTQIICVAKTAGSTKQAAYAPPAGRYNTWMHIIGRWDAANGVQIAFDGVNQATTVAAGAMDQGAGAFFVGRLAGSPTYTMKGQLGPCRVYKRRITDTEILEHYRGIYRDETSIVGAWNFSESTGITVNDDTENTNHLTLVGAPTWTQTTLDGRNDLTEVFGLYGAVDPNQTFEEHFTKNGNILLGSELMAGADWNVAALTAVVNSRADPSGTSVATKLVETAVTSQHTHNSDAVTIVANAPYAAACFFYAAERTKGDIVFMEGGWTHGAYATFDLTAKTISAATVIGTGTALKSELTDLGNGWFRAAVSGKCAAATVLGYVGIRVRDGSGNLSYLGNISNGIHVWGGQLVPVNAAGDIPGYVKSVASAITFITPQSLIDAGFTNSMAPTQSKGQYVEVIDYGVTIPSTKISLIFNRLNLLGAVNVRSTISIKLNIGDSWTNYANVSSVFALNFRYVKVTLDFASTGGNQLVKELQLTVKLDVKLISDSGSKSCVAGDATGTLVTFAITFVDVRSITVTPEGTTPVIATYDYNSANPNQVELYLWDRATGARVSGLASWNITGV